MLVLLLFFTSPSLARSIFSAFTMTTECLEVGTIATATWINAAGQNCEWTGVVGSNFGINKANGGEYVKPEHYRSLISKLLGIISESPKILKHGC